MAEQKNIILGVSGSIAAYKSADIVSSLTQDGHNVNVVFSRDAGEFITPLTLKILSKNPVVTNLFHEKNHTQPSHIALADMADLLVVAPADANTIARLANGLADDALSTVALVCQAPLLLAPAMNGKMWQHPATQENVEKLRKREAFFIGPDSGMLSCGYQGIGRLMPVDEILVQINKFLEK